MKLPFAARGNELLEGGVKVSTLGLPQVRGARLASFANPGEDGVGLIQCQNG